MSFIICHVILRPNVDVFRSVSAVGTSPWTTSRSCFLYAKPSRTCSPRLTQGSRTWPFWVTSRPASGANAGRICWNWWITSASRLSPRNCRRNQMVCFGTIVKKTVSQSSAAAQHINNVFCFFYCVCAASSLQEQWEALAAKLSQTQQQIRVCETAMVFAFVEVMHVIKQFHRHRNLYHKELSTL